MRTLRPQIQRQVERGLQSLSDEFSAEVSSDAIQGAGRQWLGEFLAQARFDDYIPVLMYHSVRERIVELIWARRSGLPALAPIGSL